MNIPKRYGESRIENCPFCGRQAIIENDQGVPVCMAHKEKLMPELKCICGEYLFMQKGKFGVYFNCLRCGNQNMKKVLEINDIMKPESTLRPEKPLTKDQMSNVKENDKKMGDKPVDNKPKNIVIRSDDPNYFD